jgi:hypothetical protein
VPLALVHEPIVGTVRVMTILMGRS